MLQRFWLSLWNENRFSSRSKAKKLNVCSICSSVWSKVSHSLKAIKNDPGSYLLAITQKLSIVRPQSIFLNSILWLDTIKFFYTATSLPLAENFPNFNYLLFSVPALDKIGIKSTVKVQILWEGQKKYKIYPTFQRTRQHFWKITVVTQLLMQNKITTKII